MLEPNFLPFPEIKTSRLLLRRLDMDDAPFLYALRTNESVMKYIDREPPKNMEDAIAMIQRIDGDIESNNGITWAICRPEDRSKLMGTLGFWRLIKQNFRAEIGYMLHPDFWRKGYMEEAVTAVIRYGFTSMRLHSIEANINPGNSASALLLEKLGFTREAYFKEDYYFRGHFLDTAIYSLLNK